ncbi:MAG TPA: polysaccharide deacetylase family protein [Candidatus Eisenbacteria bacterium]|nr:polysaccharide deacetylase family protein [Candidatus Eisenbacteria bacterium]
METDRYPYSPIIRRKPFKWPGNARVALVVAPNIEFFHIDKVIPGAASSQLPDVTGYTLRDYGSRIGVFRMMEVLDKHGVRASVLLNADVCAHHPAIIEEGNKRQWEWLGHGITNNIRMNQYPPDEERAAIRQVRDTIAAATGKPPRGWLGPGGGDESPDTLDHLAAEGFDYVFDWGCDDQPIALRVKSGRMIAIPYQQGLNDIRVMFHGGQSPADWLQMVRDQFDTLYAEGATHARVMTIPLHPFVIGLAFRIRYLDEALGYILAREGVWKTTGSEIADYFYANHYRKP